MISEEPDIEEVSELSENELINTWQKFLNTMPPSESRMINAMRNQEPIIGENNILILSFRNKSLVAEFKEKFKPSLIGYMREMLKVEVDITERLFESDEQPQTKYYTDSDKLKFMIEKNPLIARLKQEFNLDFE